MTGTKKQCRKYGENSLPSREQFAGWVVRPVSTPAEVQYRSRAMRITNHIWALLGLLFLGAVIAIIFAAVKSHI